MNKLATAAREALAEALKMEPSSWDGRYSFYCCNALYKAYRFQFAPEQRQRQDIDLIDNLFGQYFGDADFWVCGGPAIPFERYSHDERHFDRLCCLDLFACIMEDIDAIPLP